MNITDQLQSIAVNRKMPVLAVWPVMAEGQSSPSAWADIAPSAEVILVMEKDSERTEKLLEPNQAINVRLVKNRGGEKGTLAFDFFPAFSKFAEA
jgi:hypothetical protein